MPKRRVTSWVTHGILLLVVASTIFVMAGCDSGATVEVTQPLQSPLGTPTGTATGIVTPMPESNLPNWDAQPAAGKANLRGRLEITDAAVLLGELFLAEALPTSDPDIYLLELDEDNSPRATFNRTTGQFLFKDIDPGKYGLVAWEPLTSMPINDPETGETLFVDLVVDQVTDVGTLHIP